MKDEKMLSHGRARETDGEYEMEKETGWGKKGKKGRKGPLSLSLGEINKTLLDLPLSHEQHYSVRIYTKS